MLLDRRGANLDTADDYSRTPLSKGTEKGHERTVMLLLGPGDVGSNAVGTMMLSTTLLGY